MAHETAEQISSRMKKVQTASTKPELRLRKALWHLGYRYCANEKHLPGSPDIVLPKYRTVIFVHGCFWHGHKGCKNYTVPKTNTDFWMKKVVRNQERDQEVWRQLEAKGWYVIIVWECQLKNAQIEDTVGDVAAAIQQNGKTYHYLQTARKKARALYNEERRQSKAREAELKAELQHK